MSNLANQNTSNNNLSEKENPITYPNEQCPFERNRYPLPQIALHWLIVFLVIGVYLTGYSDNTGIHVLIGYLVLIFTVVRLILGRVYKKYRPAVYPANRRPSKLAKVSAILMKISLALLFLVIPTIGIIMVEFVDQNNQALLYKLLYTHALLANIGILCIGIHSGIAIYQHVVMKNDTLLRMSPH